MKFKLKPFPLMIYPIYEVGREVNINGEYVIIVEKYKSGFESYTNKAVLKQDVFHLEFLLKYNKYLNLL